MRMNDNNSQPSRRHRALSYVEVIVAMIILGMGIFVSMNLSGSYIRGQQIMEQQHIGGELARSLMAEIMSRPHNGGFPGGSGNRLGRETVGAFKNWTSPECPDLQFYPVLPHVVGCTNVLSEELAGYKRVVSVNAAPPVGDPPQVMAEITVTVYYLANPSDPPKKIYELTAYKGIG